MVPGSFVLLRLIRENPHFTLYRFMGVTFVPEIFNISEIPYIGCITDNLYLASVVSNVPSVIQGERSSLECCQFSSPLTQTGNTFRSC